MLFPTSDERCTDKCYEGSLREVVIVQGIFVRGKETTGAASWRKYHVSWDLSGG